MPTNYTVTAYILGNLDDDAGKEGSSVTTAAITLTDVNDNGLIGEDEDLLDGELIENLNDQSTLELEGVGVVTGWYIEIELDDGSKDVYFVPTDGTIPEDGILAEDVDLGGDQQGNVEDLNPVVPCFVKGSLIRTKKGEVPVELIKPGDMVITRDSGYQSVRWVGRKDLTPSDLVTYQSLRPILIAKGCFGNDVPDRDLLVSPNHRVLLFNQAARLHFGDAEVLVAAKHLLSRAGIQVSKTERISYIHLMFDKHELIWSQGAWTESFCPGPQILKGFRQEQRDELSALFPDFRSHFEGSIYQLARQELKKVEAALLL